jgi:hypothetical protein
MITVKTMKQIATSRAIASFRSLNSPIGLSSQALDRGRIALGHSQRMTHEQHRQIRNAQVRNTQARNAQ